MHAERNITCRSTVEKLQIWGSPAWILEIECFVSVWERVSNLLAKYEKESLSSFQIQKQTKYRIFETGSWLFC